MKQYKTEKESEYYILSPSLANGLTVKGERINYSDINKMNVFNSFEDYEKKCFELGIDIEDV